jgi:hypothetical protein
MTSHQSFTVIKNTKIYLQEINSAKKSLSTHVDCLKKEKTDLNMELRKTDLIEHKIDLEKQIKDIDSELVDLRGLLR